MNELEKVIKNGATIIDVRTPMEFMTGNVAGSKNIPLNEIPERLEELKSIDGKVVLCCASGGRSGQANQFLQSHGVDCLNGGSWFDVNFAAQQVLS